jgi:Carboxypeptidase regulatory-like domain
MPLALTRIARFRRFLLLVVAFLLLGAQTVAVHGQASGQLSGRVVNGSADSAAVAGATVSVSLLDGPNKKLVTTVTADDSGAYQVDGLQGGTGAVYVASVSYQDETYSSNPVSVAENGQAQADVTVYGAGSARDALSIQRLSIVLAGTDQGNGLLSIVESYRVSNSSTNAYVGDLSAGEKTSLDLPLFKGARALTPLQGFTLDDVVETSNGFALTSPVLPGENAVSFTYDVPFTSTSLALLRALAYPTQLVQLIPGSVQAKSPQLQTQSQLQLGNRSFPTLEASNLAAGSPLVIDVSGLPAQPTPLIDLDRQSVQLLFVGGIVGAIALAVVLQRRLGTRLDVQLLDRERRAFLNQIADLDEEYEGGTIDDAKYAGERERLMERLRETDRLAGRGAKSTNRSESNESQHADSHNGQQLERLAEPTTIERDA